MRNTIEKWTDELIESVGQNPIKQENDLFKPPNKILELQGQEVAVRHELLGGLKLCEKPEKVFVLAYLSQWDEDWAIRKACLDQMVELFISEALDAELFSIVASVVSSSAAYDAHGRVREAAVLHIRRCLEPTGEGNRVREGGAVRTSGPVRTKGAVRINGRVRARRARIRSDDYAEMRTKFRHTLDQISQSAPNSRLRSLARQS